MILDNGPASTNPAAVQKILFCTGKVYYDLLKERKDAGLEDKIAIHTIEQICPFPFDIMKKIADTYCNAELCFVQEEHKNMGAWSYVQPRTHTATLSCASCKRSTRTWELGPTYSHARRLLLVATIVSSSTLAGKLLPLLLLEARPHTRRNFQHSSPRQWRCKERKERIRGLWSAVV